MCLLYTSLEFSFITVYIQLHTVKLCEAAISDDIQPSLKKTTDHLVARMIFLIITTKHLWPIHWLFHLIVALGTMLSSVPAVNIFTIITLTLLTQYTCSSHKYLSKP